MSTKNIRRVDLPAEIQTGYLPMDFYITYICEIFKASLNRKLKEF
jgi:hypothetical protein